MLCSIVFHSCLETVVEHSFLHDYKNIKMPPYIIAINTAPEQMSMSINEMFGSWIMPCHWGPSGEMWWRDTATGSLRVRLTSVPPAARSCVAPGSSGDQSQPAAAPAPTAASGCGWFTRRHRHRQPSRPRRPRWVGKGRRRRWRRFINH